VVVEQAHSGYVDLAILRPKLSTLGPDRSVGLETAGFAMDSGALLKRASAGLKKLLKVHDKDRDRSVAAYSAIITAMREGFSDAEIATLIEAHRDGVGERYSERGDLLQDIARIRAKYEQDRSECEQSLQQGQEAGLPSGFARSPDGDLVRADRTKGELHKICSAIEVTARIRASLR
jgi:hypothetical protein